MSNESTSFKELFEGCYRYKSMRFLVQQKQLEFVVTNDPDLDYNLVREAWVNNEMVADVRLVDNVWKVTFFSNDEKPCELSWENVEKIYSAFSEFIKEQASPKS